MPSHAIFRSELSQQVHGKPISSFISVFSHSVFAPQVHIRRKRNLIGIHFWKTSVFCKS